MEFFDDAVNKTKEVFDVVSKKTGEVINTGKIKYEITSQKGKASKEYEKLGKIFFEQLKDEDDIPEDVKEIIKSIKEKEEKIEELNAALGEIKNCVVCPKCGATQAKNAAYCSVCGEKLDI